MGAISGLWVPVAVLAHVFGLLCLALGPVRVWLNSRGGTKAFLARRRGSIPGKLPKAHDSDDEEEDTLDVDAITRPAPLQDPTAVGPGPASVGKDDAAHQPTDRQVERVHLEWQCITCSYAGAHGKVNVLHDIWGKAEPGEMQVCNSSGQ
jgi:hypothetical protein